MKLYETIFNIYKVRGSINNQRCIGKFCEKILFYIFYYILMIMIFTFFWFMNG